MITQFIPAPKVEHHDHIALYRDHEDPFTFYYLNGHPRVQMDPITKRPKFSFILYARAIDKQNSGKEIQGGRLVMVTDLHVTENEMELIKKTVDNYVNNENFDKGNKPFYPNYNFSIKGQPKICPITFIDGKATFNLISADTNDKYITEYKPNLFGNCATTFAANYKAHESQILHDVITEGVKKGGVANMAATVNYEMKYNSIVPFRAHAKVHTGVIFSDFKDLMQKHAGVDARYYGEWQFPSDMKGTSNYGRFYSNGVNLYVSKEDLDNYIHSSLTKGNTLELTIDDYDGTGKNKELEDLVINMIKDHVADEVSSKMFDKIDPLDPSLIKNPHDIDHKMSQKAKDGEKTTPQKLGIYDISYKLKNNFNISSSNDIEITINKNQVRETPCYPSSSLEVVLDNKYNDSLVTEVNASDIYYQKMTIPIKVDVANFEKDILQISVKVKYEAEKTKREETFTFDSKNSDTQFFEVVMERDKEGKLIDDFIYRTKITYRGYDVYGSGRGDNYSEPKHQTGYNEPITITYVDIRNLNVQCRAGDVAWDIIDKLDVEFKYRDAPEKKGATKLMTLTKDNPSDMWNCYMYSGNGYYTYRIHYFYNDGTEDWSEIMESSVTNLVVNDKLAGKFTKKFDIQFDKPVSQIRVIVEFQGEEYKSEWFKANGEWDWIVRPKEDKDKKYRYMYEYYLEDEAFSKTSSWTSYKQMNAEANNSTEKIKLEIKEKPKIDSIATGLIINASKLDWEKWACVYLYVKYDDDANNLHYDEYNLPPIELTQNDSKKNVPITIKDKSIRPRLFAKYLANSGEVVESDEVTAKDNLIFLPGSVPPKE